MCEADHSPTSSAKFKCVSSPWCSTDAHETPLPLPCKVHTVAQPINKLS